MHLGCSAGNSAQNSNGGLLKQDVNKPSPLERRKAHKTGVPGLMGERCVDESGAGKEK